MASSAATGKRGFVLGQGIQQPRPKKTPKASELVMDDGTLPPMSTKTRAYFERPSTMWAAVDIETHEFVPNAKGNDFARGVRFGHFCRIDEEAVANLRIVQLGWCVGSFSSDKGPVVKQALVCPDGFEISAAAAAKHKITTAIARRDGRPLADVLCEMLRDVCAVHCHGGRVCAHQLEFDGSVIALEMERAGVESELAVWTRIVTDGFCTMNPDVTRWACHELVAQTSHGHCFGSRRPVGLAAMVKTLLPANVAMLEGHHDAGVDAHMVWLVLRELFRHAVATETEATAG